MLRWIFSLVAALTAFSVGNAQQVYVERLSIDQLEVLSPAARISGTRGEMRITDNSCRVSSGDQLRRRIVDVVVQEWGFFGFTVVDQTSTDDSAQSGRRTRGRGSRLSPQTLARVADSIAGYWSITSDGAWILDRQNAVWRGPRGIGADWRDPWSAAFVSWVMCESGLGEVSQFRRAVAHHKYIDQAIEARGKELSQSAFVAYDVGELAIEPGDLLCSARRSAYRSIEERRNDLGNGIRSHCDIVMKVDAANDRILAIGGNVRDSVSLKLLPAVFSREQGSAAPSVRSVGQDRRTVFAHLKLRAGSVETDALENSPTIRALSEQGDALAWLRRRLQGDTVTSCCQVQTISRSSGASQSPDRSSRPL